MSSLKVTIIQSNLHWGNPAANLHMFEEKINSIPEKTEIVVLPEMFTTGFQMSPGDFAEKMDGPAVLWMKKMAASKKIILTGSLIIEEEGGYFNRLVWMLPNGQCGTYDKRHRFGFAGEDQHYTAGKKRLIAAVNGWRINLQVCYDLRFPVWSRQSPLREHEGQLEYDLLVYVANWPQRRSHAWKSLLVARAIENQCYVIGLNRVGEDGTGLYHSGDSMIIGPLGEMLYQRADLEDVFTCTLDKEILDRAQATFPFWKDADDFSIYP